MGNLFFLQSHGEETAMASHDVMSTESKDDLGQAAKTAEAMAEGIGIQFFLLMDEMEDGDL